MHADGRHDALERYGIEHRLAGHPYDDKSHRPQHVVAFLVDDPLSWCLMEDAVVFKIDVRALDVAVEKEIAASRDLSQMGWDVHAIVHLDFAQPQAAESFGEDRRSS